MLETIQLFSPFFYFIAATTAAVTTAPCTITGCLNGGTFNAATCTCSCMPAYSGLNYFLFLLVKAKFNLYFF